MNDSGSFDEAFNFYSNAVNRLQDSDDDDVSSVKAEEKCLETDTSKPEVPAEITLPITNRQQRRRQQRQCASPMNFQGKRARQRRSQRAAALCTQTPDSSEHEMLNIVEINDDSPEGTNWNDFDADEGEIVWASAKTTKDLLNDGLSDPDVTISSIDVEEDLEVAIHVKWRMKGSKPFHLKKSDTLKEIFKHFAESEGVLESQISLTHNGKAISPYDTPEKLKSSVIILEGSLKATNNSAAEQAKDEADPNQIELKVLRKDKKDKLSVFIFRNEPMEVFMEKTAQKIDTPLSHLLFKFDGDTLDSSETPESLDLEGGECIEVFVRS